MTSPDPRKTASALQAWILTTDPKAQSAGITYTQDGASYDVGMTFNVEATIYPQVENYLAGYAQEHGGKLTNLQETVQDVTNDYVDSQSRLTNLRGEQQRLLALMGQAGSLNDVLTIEQRLTDVEGQIEDIQAHLAMLSGQTTYYTVRIQLSPLDTATIPAPTPWNPGQVFHDALGAALVFGQGLLTLLIWLGVFALYFVPAGALIWFGRRLVLAAARAATPPAHRRASGARARASPPTATFSAPHRATGERALWRRHLAQRLAEDLLDLRQPLGGDAQWVHRGGRHTHPLSVRLEGGGILSHRWNLGDEHAK